MLTLPRTVRVWAYPRPTDLRKGYNGLYGLVQNGLGRDPVSGEYYLFTNANRTLCKVLVWDGTVSWFGFSGHPARRLSS